MTEIDIQFPTPAHSSVLQAQLEELRADSEVEAVLLGGSLACGIARPDSDIDLLVVVAEGERPGQRLLREQVVVERGGRSAAEWIRHFTPTRVGDESWAYAFVDAVILHDPAGAGADLISAAAQALASYHVPPEITSHFAWLWSHVRPKMEAVLRSGDPVEIGWAAAAMTDAIVQTLWAVNDLPLPSRDLGTLHRHLDELTTPQDASTILRRMLQAPPERCLQLQLEILDVAARHLPAAEFGLVEI